MITSIFLGLFMVGLGVIMVKFSQQIYNFTGAIDFVERWWTGGTPQFIKLISVVLVLLGLGTVFGLWGAFTGPLTEGVNTMFGGGGLRR